LTPLPHLPRLLSPSAARSPSLPRLMVDHRDPPAILLLCPHPQKSRLTRTRTSPAEGVGTGKDLMAMTPLEAIVMALKVDMVESEAIKCREEQEGEEGRKRQSFPFPELMMTDSLFFLHFDAGRDRQVEQHAQQLDSNSPLRRLPSTPVQPSFSAFFRV
jgi:hypothetical protein